MLQLLYLFGLMFGIGALTYGGGYAIVGVMQVYLVDKLHWLTLSEFTSGLVVGQVTPGPLSTMVAYAGYKVAGLSGSLLATLGLLLPSFIASVSIARAYQQVKQATWVQAAIKGVSLAVVALLGGAILTLGKDALIDPWTVLIAAATFYVTGPRKRDPLIPFIVAAILGIFIYR